ncbi:MAG: Holliday junction DNA helicase RuvA [Spirochaetes bacterium RBG_16_49_21]|nr:MAG: Holliday junction DNA helicase RuvA [Spirochaetes bacterium RBG_16_49_21]
MISKITGTIDELKPTEVVLDVHGVGYGLSIPLSTYEKIQACKEVTLYVYTLHREDQLRLLGFYTEEEKNIFTILLNISGIGPAMALSILSGISIARLIEAVQTENPSLLTGIPGIGKAKAEKLIFELKRKMKKLTQYAGKTEERYANTLRNDAIEALVNLGYDESRASRAVDGIITDKPDSAIEHIIKEALKSLS